MIVANVATFSLSFSFGINQQITWILFFLMSKCKYNFWLIMCLYRCKIFILRMISYLMLLDLYLSEIVHLWFAIKALQPTPSYSMCLISPLGGSTRLWCNMQQQTR